MPRRPAHGRPGTQVIPAGWEANHAVVVAKTYTATVKIFPRNTTDAPVMADDFTYPAGAAPDPLYDGAARIQALNGQEAAALIADQKVVTTGYLVVIDRDAADIPIGSIVQVTEASDPTLVTARRLVVRKVARGSLRWERDLWCTDDLSHQPTEA